MCPYEGFQRRRLKCEKLTGQNFSRAKDTCCYVYLKPGICILSKQVTQLYLYLTYIFKGENQLSNEKKYI
jgi:hypothetical protein